MSRKTGETWGTPADAGFLKSAIAEKTLSSPKLARFPATHSLQPKYKFPNLVPFTPAKLLSYK
jgi:hypothetical protein